MTSRNALRRVMLRTAFVLVALALSGCAAPAVPEPIAVATVAASPDLAFGAEGDSRFNVIGACVMLIDTSRCAPVSGWYHGEFETAGPLESVHVTVEWSADHVLEDRMLAVLFADGEAFAHARGTSPLALHVPTLDAGTYSIGLWTGEDVSAMVDVTAHWIVNATTRPG